MSGSRRTRGGALLLTLLIAGCATLKSEGDSTAGTIPERAEDQFALADIVKTDINLVVEAHQREALTQLRLLMEKLYRRNPVQLRRSTSTLEERVTLAFSGAESFPEFADAKGAAAVELAFSAQFQGDRVFAFVVGLRHMVMAAYNFQNEFFVLSSLDPQKLYNSARNMEVAAWRLSNSLAADGTPLIYSNEASGAVRNLSFERLFGKLIAIQDVMARIVAQKTKRVIKDAIQFLLFLPI